MNIKSNLYYSSFGIYQHFLYLMLFNLKNTLKYNLNLNRCICTFPTDAKQVENYIILIFLGAIFSHNNMSLNCS